MALLSSLRKQLHWLGHIRWHTIARVRDRIRLQASTGGLFAGGPGTCDLLFAQCDDCILAFAARVQHGLPGRYIAPRRVGSGSLVRDPQGAVQGGSGARTPALTGGVGKGGLRVGHHQGVGALAIGAHR